MKLQKEKNEEIQGDKNKLISMIESHVMYHCQGFVLIGIREKVCPKKEFEGGQCIKFVDI